MSGNHPQNGDIMALNEQIVTGRKFRKCIDAVNKVWQRISFWTKACDVEFEDGMSAEAKIGAVKGITADLTTTEEGYAADMTILNRLTESGRITDLKVVSALPADAAEHPTTFYLIEG